jgi:hypothetical protein
MSDNNRDNRRAQLMKRMEESQIGKEILKVLRQRLETSPTLQQTLKSDEFKGGEYTAERKVLMSINNFGLGEGILAGMATFLVLRRGPQFIVRLLNRRSGGGGGVGGGGYRLDKPSASSGNSPFQQQQQQSNNQQSSGVAVTVMGGLKLALDIFVSMLMAATTSFSVIDEKTLVNSVATLPLGEGRSVVSDEFCVTMQQEIAKRNPAIFANADSPYLKGMYAFSQNCSRRQSYEAVLREESGMSPTDPVSIPSGGVPADYQIMVTDGTTASGSEDDDDASHGASTTDESYFSDSGGFGSDNIFGDDSMSEQDKQWSDSIVTDREDNQKQN